MKTRAELLAQLEAEQAAGDPSWFGRTVSRTELLAQLEAEQEAGDPTAWRDIHAAVFPIRRTVPTTVRVHNRSRRAA